ncbi:hypothetical protein QEN19_002103 [Hanseniaspora menglaensis]
MSVSQKTKSAILFLSEPVHTDLYEELVSKYQIFNFRFAKKGKSREEQQEKFLEYVSKNFYPATKHKLDALYLGYAGFAPLPAGLTIEMIENNQQLQYLKVVVMCSRGINNVPYDYLTKNMGAVVQNYDDSELYVANDVADCGVYHVLESFRKFSYQQSKLREVLHSDGARGHLRGDAEDELRFCFGHELKVIDDDGTLKSQDEVKTSETNEGKEKNRPVQKKETTDVYEYMYTISPMNKKALILGFGNIGQTLAKKLKYGLSMDVYYSTRSGKNTLDKSMDEFSYYPWGEWTENLSQFDCIILCLPLSPQTKHIVDEKFLLNCARFKQGNLNHLSLVNLGRGMLIDWANIPKDFIKTKIRHVGLDVFYAEPLLTRECDDLTISNSTITPHIGSSTFEVFNRSSEFCLDVIKKHLD